MPLLSPFDCTSLLPSAWPQEQARAQRPRAGAPLPLSPVRRAVCVPGWARAPRVRAPAAARVGGVSPEEPPRVAAGGWGRAPSTHPRVCDRGECGRATALGVAVGRGNSFFFALPRVVRRCQRRRHPGGAPPRARHDGRAAAAGARPATAPPVRRAARTRRAARPPAAWRRRAPRAPRL